MKTTLYTLADMKGFNLKTEEARAIARALGKPRIISRDNIFPFGSLIPKFFTLLKIRNSFIKWMDARAPTPPVDLAVFFPHCFYKTCSFLKKFGVTTINFVTSGIGEKYAELEKEAYDKFGMKIGDYNEYALKSALASDYAVVTSNWFKELLISEGFPEENIYMTHIGVNIDKYKPGKKKDDIFRVIMVADFTPLKGIKYLIDAWRILKLKKAELYLVGNMPNEIEEYLDPFRDMSIYMYPHTNPIPYYQNSSLFVMPSLSEGSTRTMYEAMACGLPVIVTENVGAVIKDRDKTFKVVTENTGRIIPIKDSKALAKAIKWFYTNRGYLTKELGKVAREHVKQFTWENYTKRIKEILGMIKNENSIHTA